MTFLLSFAFAAYGLNFFMFTSGAGNDLTLSRILNLIIFILFLASYFHCTSNFLRYINYFANHPLVKICILNIIFIVFNLSLFHDSVSEILYSRKILDFASLLEDLIPLVMLPLLLLIYSRIGNFISNLKIFFFSIIYIGFADYTYSFIFDHNSLIHRHILDGSLIESSRFHSLIGEPRHVGGWLSMMIFTIVLFSPKLTTLQLLRYSFFFLIPLILTQSTTLLLSLSLSFVLFLLTLFVQLIHNQKIARPHPVILILFIVLFASLFFLFSSERVSMYINDYNDFFYNLQSPTAQLSYLQSKSISNVLPLKEYHSAIINLDLQHILFGYGLSSSSFLSVIIDNTPHYPNSAFSRIVYELGVAGLVLFLLIYSTSYSLLSSLLQQSSQFRRVLLQFLLAFCFTTYLVDVNNCLYATIGALVLFSKVSFPATPHDDTL